MDDTPQGPKPEEHTVNQSTAHKRRIKLIQPSLQLRLIGAFAGVTALALIAQVLVLGVSLSRFAGGLGASGAAFVEALPGLLGTCLAASVALVLPALVLIGVRVTFRVAGPLYRMERHLEAVARGEQPGPCRIREHDQLQQFCATLNEALARTTASQAAPPAVDEAELERAA